MPATTATPPAACHQLIPSPRITHATNAAAGGCTRRVTDENEAGSRLNPKAISPWPATCETQASRRRTTQPLGDMGSSPSWLRTTIRSSTTALTRLLATIKRAVERVRRNSLTVSRYPA